MVKPVAMNISDWNAWHEEYDDPNSELAFRLRLVQARVVAAVDTCEHDPVAIVSICGGQGREVIGALEKHPKGAPKLLAFWSNSIRTMRPSHMNGPIEVA